MADNSKYITQLRRETSRTSFKSTSPKATVTRHATSWALSKKAMDAAASHESPPLRSKPSQVTANIHFKPTSTSLVSKFAMKILCALEFVPLVQWTSMVQFDTVNFMDSSPCSIVQWDTGREGKGVSHMKHWIPTDSPTCLMVQWDSHWCP